MCVCVCVYACHSPATPSFKRGEPSVDVLLKVAKVTNSLCTPVNGSYVQARSGGGMDGSLVMESEPCRLRGTFSDDSRLWPFMA